MDMCPAAISAIILGIKKGLNRGTPEPVAKSPHSFKNVSNPPIPEPQMTPARSKSICSKSSCESAIASDTATIAYMAYISNLRASFLSKKSVGTKSLTSHAN